VVAGCLREWKILFWGQASINITYNNSIEIKVVKKKEKILFVCKFKNGLVVHW
jgi:hypothetical protein